MSKRIVMVIGLVLALGGTLLGTTGCLGSREATIFSDPVARDAAVTEILNRRAQAVRDKNLQAFVAELDPSRPELLEADNRTFANLTRLPFTVFTYTLSRARYELKDSSAAKARYKKLIVVPGVTIRYRIQGVDDADVATPYVPIFGYRAGRWVLAGEVSDDDVDSQVPFGIGTQPWQGDPIAVKTTANGVLVYSPADEEKAVVWARWIEEALTRVKKFRPDKWSGKVFVVAVRDKKLITEHLQKDTDRTAAIAVPRADRISEWMPSAEREEKFAGTLVLFNPDQLDEGDEEILSTITHEFTHAALNPVTGDHTPRWLVEGTAVYVEFGDQVLSQRYAKKYLADKDTSRFPADDKFYESAQNYDLSLLICQTIAKKYGEKKLIALYEWFERAEAGSQDQGVRAILGVSLEQLTAEWRKSVQDTIAG